MQTKQFLRRTIHGLSCVCSLALIVAFPHAEAAASSGRTLHTLLSHDDGRVRQPDYTHPVDDREVQSRLVRGFEELRREGKITPLERLAAQLAEADKRHRRTRLPVPDPKVSVQPQTNLVQRLYEATVVVGGVYKCPKCGQWHSQAASGFFLSADGVLATSAHVIDQKNVEGFVVLTADGRVWPVTQVLAANRRTDLALVKVAGTGFTTLPLNPQVPIGTRVRVLSHPDRHFYSLTEGIVSRYYVRRASRRAVVTMMAITADFGRGSSGAPVVDTSGAVVGIVHSTSSLYYHEEEKRQEDLQMVFKSCVPAAYLLDLIE